MGTEVMIKDSVQAVKRACAMWALTAVSSGARM